jgi:hypothetical protein
MLQGLPLALIVATVALFLRWPHRTNLAGVLKPLIA